MLERLLRTGSAAGAWATAGAHGRRDRGPTTVCAERPSHDGASASSTPIWTPAPTSTAWQASANGAIASAMPGVSRVRMRTCTGSSASHRPFRPAAAVAAPGRGRHRTAAKLGARAAPTFHCPRCLIRGGPRQGGVSLAMKKSPLVAGWRSPLVARWKSPSLVRRVGREGEPWAVTVAVPSQSPSTAQGTSIEVCEGTDGHHRCLP